MKPLPLDSIDFTSILTQWQMDCLCDSFFMLKKENVKKEQPVMQKAFS